MTKIKTNKSVVIQLRFTTTDGHELSIPDYAAVPAERLRKLEQIATTARELLAASGTGRGHCQRHFNHTSKGAV